MQTTHRQVCGIQVNLMYTYVMYGNITKCDYWFSYTSDYILFSDITTLLKLIMNINLEIYCVVLLFLLTTQVTNAQYLIVCFQLNPTTRSLT